MRSRMRFTALSFSKRYKTANAALRDIAHALRDMAHALRDMAHALRDMAHALRDMAHALCQDLSQWHTLSLYTCQYNFISRLHQFLTKLTNAQQKTSYIAFQPNRTVNM